MTLSAERFWRERPQAVLLASGLALAAFVAAGSALSTPSLAGSANGMNASDAPPAPPPLIMRQVAPNEALAINSTVPLHQGPNPAAKPFTLGSADANSRERALDCLTSAVYYEAGAEDADGQRAVAQVVLNRLRHPAFPASVCGVVYEGSTRPTGCQFTFTCDGALLRQPRLAGWQRARTIAEAALDGFVYRPVGIATHYHADYVIPYWASTLTKNAVVGAHIFYRWPGSWGRPAAFAQGYADAEPDSAALKASAIIAERRDQATRSQSVAAAEAIAEIPGAEPLKLAPSMRGDKRVAVRFNLTARKAASTARHEDYVEKVKASDNLRWALDGGVAATQEKPLGAPASSGTAIAAGASVAGQ